MTGKDFLQAVLSAGPCKEEKTVSNFSEEEFEQVIYYKISSSSKVVYYKGVQQSLYTRL